MLKFLAAALVAVFFLLAGQAPASAGFWGDLCGLLGLSPECYLLERSQSAEYAPPASRDRSTEKDGDRDPGPPGGDDSGDSGDSPGDPGDPGDDTGASKPGHGHGDKNHDHSGPPGQDKDRGGRGGHS